MECVPVIVRYARKLGPCFSIRCDVWLTSREGRLNQALWYRGSEMRLKRFLLKAKRGQGFTVGVVGGSGMSPSTHTDFIPSFTR